MNIISLEASNILRLSAIQIQANGQNVTLSGKNGSGKTSVLRAIEMALGGKTLTAEVPVHAGADKGKIILDLGEFIVTRTFGKGGTTTLNVTSKEGAKFPTPQSILDGLVGQLTFDPLAFTRMKPEKQSETIRKLVGLDFTALNAEAKKVYDDRTIINRELETAKTLLASKTRRQDVPAEEKTATEILNELGKATAHNAKKATLKTAADQADSAWKDKVTKVNALKDHVENLRFKLAEAQSELVTIEAEVENLDAAADTALNAHDAFQLIDTDALAKQLQDLEAVNAKVRENAAYRDAEDKVKAKTEQSEAKTLRLEQIDDEKQKMLESAPFPVAGMSFTESGVLYKNLPFEQASMGEQLRISASIGMALNPRLKVLMIRDASLIDEDGMTMLTEMAAERGYQLWLERVSAGSEVSVVIEEKEAA